MIERLSNIGVKKLEEGVPNPFVAVSLLDLEKMVGKVNELVNHINTLEAPRFGEWISVKDKLPNNFVHVLVHIHFYGSNESVIEIDTLKFGKWDTFESSVFKSNCEITHWMPLPEPPKEGAENG